MASSRRKVGIGLLITALVLVGLLIAVDRGAAWAAEGEIADRVADRASAEGIESPNEPDVNIEGFPFLTQVIGGEYRSIRITMRDVTVDDVSLSEIDVRAKGVQAPASELMSGGGDIRADEVTGDATLPYSMVAERIGVADAEVSARGDQLEVRAPVSFFGQEFLVVALADIQADDGVITVDVTDAEVDDADLPDGAQSMLNDVAEQMSGAIDVPALPYDLVVEDIEVTQTGLVATASARDVPLTS